MDEAARAGQIYVIEEVVAELTRTDACAHDWVQGRDIVVSIDEDVQREVVEIMRKYPRLVDTRKNRSGCDPWVIALARARTLTVVTAEKPTSSLDKPKIPDVCQDLKVPCVEVIEFFRRQGWRL